MMIGRGLLIFGALLLLVGVGTGIAAERPAMSTNLTNAQANGLALDLLTNFETLSAEDVPQALNELHEILPEMTLQERRDLLQIVVAAQALLMVQQPRANQQVLTKFLDDSKRIVEEYNKKNPR